MLLILFAIFWAREKAVFGIFSIEVLVFGIINEWPFDSGFSSRIAMAFWFSSILWLGISPLIIDSKIGVSGACDEGLFPGSPVAGPCCSHPCLRT